MKRKILISLFVLIASVGSIFAWDRERIPIGNLYYNLDATNHTAAVTYMSKNDATGKYNEGWNISTASIPSYITFNGINYSVTSIGSFAFDNCTKLTSVTIPISVTSIGSLAFYGCTSLTNVNIPDSVASIGNGAFKGCASLTNINLPNSITNIKYQAFYGCASLSSIVIPDNVTELEASIFYNCSSLTSANIPNGITSIPSKTFYNCRNLTNITIPNSVTSIGESAFYGCSNLPTPTYFDNLSNIGASAFNRCTSFTDIIIPDNILRIEESAFAGCSNVKNIKIGDGIQGIPKGVFSCENAETIEVGKNVRRISKGGGFNACTHVKKVIWNAKNCADLNESYEDSPFKKSISADPQLEAVEIIIGDSVEYIPATLFTDVPIKKITIGKNVTSFGEYPFGCGQYTLSNRNNTIIDIEVVWNAKNLTKRNLFYFIYIGGTSYYGSMDAVTYDIGSSISSLTIGNNVETLPQNFFAQLPELKNIKWNAISCEDFSETTCPNNLQVDSFSLGEYVEHIPSYLFSNAPNLKNLSIPSTLKSVGQNAFLNCPNIDSIYCTDLSAWASIDFENDKATPLYGNGKLLINNNPIGKNIEIQEGVTHIGKYAFYNCQSIENIVLPSSINSIGQNAFNTCPYLLTIHAAMEYPPIIEYNVFANCGSLYGITLYVPQNSLAQYRKANVWSSFRLQAEIPKFTITFMDWDNTELLKLYDVEENTIPVYTGNTPTRSGDAQYSYTFAGWSPTIVAATSDATYTATYNQTTNQYTITFLNYDNSVLSSKLWDYGSTPTCELPTKKEDDKYTYTFDKWAPDIVPVVGEATYTATYTATPKSQGIEDIYENSAERPIKYIEKGEIYILMPNGKKYSIVGELIK